MRTRVFKTLNPDGNEVVLEFRRPSQQTLSKADLVGKAAWSEAFRGGILINKEALKLLRQRGMWGDEQERQEKQLGDEIAALEASLTDELTNEEGQAIVKKIREKRLELDELQQIVTDVTGGTCESVASQEKNMFLAAECVFNHETGQKVYKNLEDFKQRLSEVQTIESYKEATIASLESAVGVELPSDLTLNYSENQWLAERGIEEGEEGQESEEPAAEEAEEEKPKRKKRGRPRKTKAS